MDELRIELEVLKSCNSKLEECAKSFSTNFSNFSFDSLGQSSVEILSGVQSAINRCIEEINYLYVYHYQLFNSFVNNIAVVDKVLSRQKGNLSDEDVNAIINTLPNLEADNDITFDKDWDVNIEAFDQVFEEEVSKGKSSTEVASFVTYAKTQMNLLAIQIESGTLTEEEKKLAVEQYNEWVTYANKWTNSTVDVMSNEKKVSELNNEILQEYVDFYNSNIYERDYDGYVTKVNEELNKLKYKIKNDKNMSIEEQNLARQQYEAYRQIAEALARGYGVDSTAKRQLEELDIKISNYIKDGITEENLVSISNTINDSITLMKQQINSGNYSEEEIYSMQTQINFLTEYSKKLDQGKDKVSKADAEFEKWVNSLSSNLEFLQGDSVTSSDIANCKNKLLMELSDNGNLSEIEQNVLNRKKIVIDSLVSSLDEAYTSYKEVEDYASNLQNNKQEYLELMEEKKSLQSLVTRSASVEQRIAEIDQTLYSMATSSEDMFQFAYSKDASFQINYDFYSEDVNEYSKLASELDEVMSSKEYVENQLKNPRLDGNSRKYYEKYLKDLNSKADSLNQSIEEVAYRSENILTYVYSNNESFRENYDLKVENQQKFNNALSDLDSLYNTKADLEIKLANATYSGERDFYNKALSETNKKISDAANIIGYSDTVSKTYLDNQNLVPIFEDKLEQKKAELELIDDEEEKAKLEKDIDFYEKAIDNGKNVNSTIGMSSYFSAYDVESLKAEVVNLEKTLNSGSYLPTSVREEIKQMISDKNVTIAEAEIYSDLNLEELLKSGNDYSNINKGIGNIYDDAMHDCANWDYIQGLSDDQLRNFLKVNILKDAALQAYEYDPSYFEERHDFYLNKGNKVYNKINPDKTAEEVEQERQQIYNQLEQQKLNDMVANGDFWGYTGYNFSKTVVEGVEDAGNAVSQTFDELYHYGVSLQQQHYKLKQQYENGEIDAWDLYRMGVGCAYATTAQVGSSILTGVGRFVEGVVDGVVTISAGLESIFTLGIDLCAGTNTTAALYENLGNFVGTDYVGNIENAFYETNLGQWIDENALFTHDSAVSGVIKGVSEATAAIVTGSGVTKALSSLSKVSSATSLLNFSNSTLLNTFTNTTNVLTTISAVKGYGQGMERALNDGASYGDAATYALYSGVWEGAQWYVGSKINSYAQNSLASGANSAKVLTSAVTADTVDSAIEGFVQPALQMTYSDKSYEQLFDENGGWSTVMQQALIGGIMSTVGTYGDVRAARKQSSLQNIKLDEALSTNNASDSVNLKQTISDKLESKITPAGLKDIDVDSKINVSDSVNLKQTIADKLESKITPAGLKDIDVDSKINVSDSTYKFKGGDADSLIYNVDGNKVNIANKLKNNVKTVGGAFSASAGVLGVLSGNPVFAIPGGVAFVKGIKTSFDGILGNYVKDSNFAIQRHKLTPAIDASIETGKYYAKGNLTTNSIVTDRIGQSAFGGDVFLTGRLDSNQTRVFGLPLVNMLQQLETYDVNSNQIIYSCESQSQTVMFLKKLAKEGYIEDLKYCESKSSAQNFEKFLMGANVTNKNHQLYEINFKLSPDKVFDVSAANKMAETLKFDANLYNSKTKTINGKEVVIFKANIPKLLENQVNAKISMSGLKGIDIDVDSKINISDSVNLKQTISDKLESKITPAGLKDIDVDSKINVSDSVNLKQTIADKLESKITPAGLKDIDVDSKTNVFESANLKQTVSDKLESKTTAGLTKNIDVDSKISVFEDLVNLRNSLKEQADYLNSLTPEELVNYQESRIKPENQQLLNKIKEEFITDDVHTTAVNQFINTMNYLLENGSDDGKLVVESMLEIKKKHPEFSFFTTSDGDSSAFVSNNEDINYIKLTISDVDKNFDCVIIHELGHALHSMIDNCNVPENFWSEIAPLALENMKKHSDEVRNIFIDYQNERLKLWQIIKSENDDYINEVFENYYIDKISKELEIRTKFWKDRPSIFTEFDEKEFLNIINSSEIYTKIYQRGGVISPNLESFRALQDLSKKASNEIFHNAQNSARLEYDHNELFTLSSHLDSGYSMQFIAISEMLSGVVDGQTNFQEMFDLKDYVVIGHPNGYFSKNHFSGYSEFVTEYSKLKFTNNIEIIDKMRYLLGNEFVDTLDNEYNKIINSLKNLKGE